MCFVGPTLKEKVTMATWKGLSTICKFQNLTNTYSEKLPNFKVMAFAGLEFRCIGLDLRGPPVEVGLKS